MDCYFASRWVHRYGRQEVSEQPRKTVAARLAQQWGIKLVIRDYAPGQWYLPTWAERVTAPALLEAFEQHSVPDEYVELLKVHTYLQAKQLFRYEVFEGLGLLLRPAMALAAGHIEPPFRYDGQPASLYPFAHPGVDGISFNFYFQGSEHIVVEYSPMDFDEEVLACYGTLRDFLTARILEALTHAEGQADEPFSQDTWRDAALLILALDLELPDVSPGAFKQAQTDAVRARVQAGEYSDLGRWLMPTA